MPIDFKQTKLGAFAPFIYGKGLPELERKTGPVPVYGSNGIVGYHNESYVKKSGVIIGRKGTVGAVHFSKNPFWPIDTAFYVEDEPEKRNLDYLYYLLKTLGLNQMNNDSAVPGLNREQAHAIEIKIPSKISDQQNQVKILKDLDTKIDNNNLTNEALESIAKAIFKEWFIDFGPVKAKSEGKKPFGMDDETAELFPDSFDETDLGFIPKGWNEANIDDYVTIKHGFAFKGEYFSDDKTLNILLTPGNFRIGGGFKSDKLKYYSGPVESQYELRKNDLVITMTDLSKAGDTLGYPALVPESYNLEKFLHNQRVGLVVFKIESNIKFWMYQLFLTEKYRSWILGTSTGSTVKHTSPSRIQEFRFIAPPLDLIERYNKLVLPFFEKIQQNELEKKCLMEMRDLLLPKLISGEIVLKEPNV